LAAAESESSSVVVSEDQNDVSIAFQPLEKEPVHAETLTVLRNVGLFFLADADDLAAGVGYFIDAPEESKAKKRSNSIFAACDIL